MRIGDLAAAAGVATSLVRYYEERGIIPPPVRRGFARIYDEIRRLRVKRALLRHAGRTGSLTPGRYARILAKIGA
jgi:DNA-binding transcriptional MerR regulator